jgi:hypothetical protein
MHNALATSGIPNSLQAHGAHLLAEAPQLVTATLEAHRVRLHVLRAKA